MTSKGPIILWHNHTEQRTDDAGTTILTSICPPPALFDPGPYEDTRRDADRDSNPLRYVPSLAYFCIKSLLQYPDQIHGFGSPRIAYERPAISLTYDILRALVPSYDPWPEEGVEDSLDLPKVDPRLWAVIVQVFTNLPDEFRVYPIALSDKHLPLLQHIPQRDDFSLLTILELSHCSHLTDDTILELKALHGLCALDASETPLSAQGILRLSRTLAWADGHDNASSRRGPWQLRILYLRNCKNVKNAVFDALPAFPLLSIVDLRGSSCSANTLRFPAGFYTSTEPLFYHPTKIVASLSALASSPNLFSSDNYYALHIHKRHYGGPMIGQTSHTQYPVSLRPRPTVAPEDSYVVLPASNGKTASIASKGPIVTPGECSPRKKTPKIKTGNSEILAIRAQKREKEHRHFINSMEWQARRERLEEKELRDRAYASEGSTDTREFSDASDHVCLRMKTTRTKKTRTRTRTSEWVLIVATLRCLPTRQ
ncbi:hypothetical protein EWM64_g1917 [Hericium alpestre]|uniref:Uncharacterized protein n=1 Tax=Hericium alpestre TaxID=135208 RepID=A0A4Z0A739_9AGAM|nr:hypothetical protein EWM64_g1917 [Hericium alpestre]